MQQYGYSSTPWRVVHKPFQPMFLVSVTNTLLNNKLSLFKTIYHLLVEQLTDELIIKFN